MKTMPWVSIVAVAALAACGSSDPLLGTWGNSTNTQTNASSATLTLQFASGKKITATGITIFENSSPTLPGCTRTVITSGTYSEVTSTSTVTFNYTAGTTQAANCLNASDDNDEAVALSSDVLANYNGDYTYGVSGDNLSLTVGSDQISYTKQ